MYRREFFIGGGWAGPAGGGFKESGLGRELGPEGLRSFLEPRSIGLPVSLVPSIA